jgi:mannose-6-phosphate isomerase
MHRLHGSVRPYAWGSTTAIPELLGVPADGTPQAELWLGAHPSCPARLDGPDGSALSDAIEADARHWLGTGVHARFGPRLPFLLKVLAAAAPLSLQVHPDPAQARSGFAAEERAGVPADAPTRNYKDPHHKPEMILALTPFEALCAFRDPAESLLALAGLTGPGVQRLRALLDGPDPASALRDAVAWLLCGAADASAVAGELTDGCHRRSSRSPAAHDLDRLVDRLARSYPADPGIGVAALLHHVVLEPGQALYLPPGNVHAYLDGTGVEIMAASDNVLRGGLTPKHVDVDELLRIVDFRPRPLPVVTPTEDGPTRTFAPGPEEFRLSIMDLDGAVMLGERSGPRLVLCLEGHVLCRSAADELRLERGAAAAVADADGTVEFTGKGTTVVAAVPAAR